MKVKHHEAERELQHQEKIFREAMEKYDSSCLALVKLALCWPNFGCSFASWVEHGNKRKPLRAFPSILEFLLMFPSSNSESVLWIFC